MIVAEDMVIRPATGRWRVRFEGHVIADSRDALIVHEAGRAPMVYFPRRDVATEYLARTPFTAYCPSKGAGAYYTIMMDGRFAENAARTFEAPMPGAEMIRNRLAFFSIDIEIYQVAEQDVNPHGLAVDVDDVVRHTDCGAGRAQAERWTPPPR